MTRRLLGPVGGPILFLLAAALVFGVLGWVTHSALAVERAQREAAARAELGSNLRVALWRLDGRMLPALGVEDSRPFYHYGPADPNGEYGYGVATTPLLVTALPDWMKLHFQLDAANGWESPQVLTADVAERVRQAWPELPLRNVNGEREALLADLRKKYPSREMLDLFTSRDKSTADDALAMAAPPGIAELEPLPAPVPPPAVVAAAKPFSNSASALQQSSATGTTKWESFRLFGIEVCVGPEPANGYNHAANQPRLDADNQNPTVPFPSQTSPATNGVIQNRSRSQGAKELDNTLGKADNNDRDGTVTRAMKDVQPPPGTAQRKGQYSLNNSLNSNFGANYAQGANDLKIMGNQGVTQGTTPGVAGSGAMAVAGGIAGPQGPSSGAPAAGFGPVTAGPAPMPPGMGGGGSIGPQRPGSSPALPPGTTPNLPSAPQEDKENANTKRRYSDTGNTPLGGAAKNMTETAKSELDKTSKPEAMKLTKDAEKKLTSEESFFSRLVNRFHKETLLRSSSPQLSKGSPSSLDEQAKMRETELRAPAASGATLPPVPPMLNPNPIPNEPTAWITPPSGVMVQSLPIHLGSMRPQWVVGPDGSEMLVLVRVAKVDNRTLCQGIILDWKKLEAMLQDEVKDLFPNAKLIPIKDPEGVSPDRAMTALPIQLDPGLQPELPPAGWTPLRLGLVLAWIAAAIAFAAVGFSGWTLIDLAERRIRFVSAVTHELRTPLTSLRLYLDLLVSGMIQDEAKKQEYLNTLATESDRLHRLIDNVLDFARLEKRRKDGDIKPVKVVELLEQLRQTWTDRLAQEGKELVVISTLAEGREVKTDAAMIQQIVANLIDNARKYARDAADRRIWVWAKPGSRNSVLIEVEDRGPGVPANERRSIFKPFRRGEQADSSSGGAGLGLALAKSWAEVLGGRLTYRPADGGTGACFRLELPAS